MKLKHIKNGEETVIMEAPHEDALKARASKLEGYPHDATWRRGPFVDPQDQPAIEASKSEPSELDLDDGSLLRITTD